MKGYSILSRSPEMEPHYQMQLSVLSKTLFGGERGDTPLQEIQVSIF